MFFACKRLAMLTVIVVIISFKKLTNYYNHSNMEMLLLKITRL